jgi:diadenosine tetraphosphatase ApaH/serine/threonine PP2A family protein phosphatase
MGMVASGDALCIPGNHDVKLSRKLRGRDVRVAYGLAETLAQLEDEPPAFGEEVAAFLDGLVSHYVFDDGNLVVAHAGLKESLQGRASRRVRDFDLFGETTGETDEFGLPVRYDWAAGYRGRAAVVYGHTPVPEAEWVNRTINIDTGCAFGGRLTALRYPELELVSVPAKHTYYRPARPFLAPDAAAPAIEEERPYDDLLDIGDVAGKRIIPIRLQRNVTIREENAAAALEVMSRFAVDPCWLVYLPPTMSPSETSERPDLLEHPAEAFAYYRQLGVPEVISEEKHMGSRAISWCAGTSEPPAPASGSRRAQASALRAPGGASSRTRSWRRACSRGCGRPWISPASGRCSARIGCAWTVRSCPGRSRPGSSCAASTPPSAPRPVPRSPPLWRRWRRPPLRAWTSVRCASVTRSA